MNDKVKEAIINLNYLVECRCDEAYTDRGRHDPHSACDYAEEVKIVADHVAAIEDKLSKAMAALQLFKDFDDLPLSAKRPDVLERRVRHQILVSLAEIKG